MSAVTVGFPRETPTFRMTRTPSLRRGTSSAKDSASALRDRAFAALLLLVGAAAVASGLSEIFVLSNPSPAAIFDSVLGGAVLLVTWLFVVPGVWPSWYGDPLPGEPPIRRPYLANAIVATSARPLPTSSAGRPGPSPAVSAPSAKKEPEIPRWADPLVTHFPAIPESAAPPASEAKPQPRDVENPAPPPRRPPVHAEATGPVAPPSRPTSESYPDAEFLVAPEAPVRSVASPAFENNVRPQPRATGEVIRELDLITAELRNPPRRSVPRSAGHPRTQEDDPRVDEVASGDDPLSGFD